MEKAPPKGDTKLFIPKQFPSLKKDLVSRLRRHLNNAKRTSAYMSD